MERKNGGLEDVFSFQQVIFEFHVSSLKGIPRFISEIFAS